MNIKNSSSGSKISLTGSIALGTGVMIGAGIFVLMGQIAQFVGGLFPIVFLAGAVVVGFSSYSYVKFSNAFPSSGGVAKFLTKAYGPGTAAGTLSLLMYVSMVVAESLVARTFGSYTLRLFSPEYSIYASTLGVLLIVIAYIINVSGNKIIERTAIITAILKVLGIAILAIAGIAIAGFPSFSSGTAVMNTSLPSWISFIAATALAILAYKGFTTITNQGGDIKDPHKNVGRSIIISIIICTILYIALALSVAAGLSVPEIIAAKDYALAQAAEPLFGQFGILFTILLAIIATVSGVIASVFSASRLLAMLSKIKQIPKPSFGKIHNPTLLITATLAIFLTIFFDLTRIAAIGAIFYLIMDISINWGLLRHLRKTIPFNPIIPLITVFMDASILGAFIYVKYLSDPFILVISFVSIILIIVAEYLFMLYHTDKNHQMHMVMD